MSICIGKSCIAILTKIFPSSLNVRNIQNDFEKQFEFGLWSLTNMTLFIDQYSFINQTLEPA